MKNRTPIAQETVTRLDQWDYICSMEQNICQIFNLQGYIVCVVCIVCVYTYIIHKIKAKDLIILLTMTMEMLIYFFPFFKK